MKVQSFIIPKSLPSELYFQVDRGKRLYPKLHQHKRGAVKVLSLKETVFYLLMEPLKVTSH